jgi:hypothetical protein
LRKNDHDIEELRKQLNVRTSFNHDFFDVVIIISPVSICLYLTIHVYSLRQASQQSIGKLNRTIKQLELHGSSEIDELKNHIRDSTAAYNDVSEYLHVFYSIVCIVCMVACISYFRGNTMHHEKQRTFTMT